MTDSTIAPPPPKKKRKIQRFSFNDFFAFFGARKDAIWQKDLKDLHACSCFKRIIE